MEDTYKLLYPIKGANGKQITTVKFRRLKGKDMRAASRLAKQAGADSEIDMSFYLLGRATGLDVSSEIEELDLEDLEAMTEHMGKSRASQSGGQTGKL